MPDESADTTPKVITPCRHQGHLFFSDILAEQEAAKTMCATCPFRGPCLQKGIRTSAAGIWGGFDEIERGYWRALFGDTVGSVVRPLPKGLLAQLRANKVMKTGPDAIAAQA